MTAFIYLGIERRIEPREIEQGGGFGLDFFAEGGGFEDADSGTEAEDQESGVFFALETDLEGLPGFG